MIHVDRAAAPEPALFRSARVARLRASLVARFAIEDRPVRKQARVEFRPLWVEAREPLTALFRGKCAYCESVVGVTDPGDVDHFRPKASVRTADGTRLEPGYWWLAYEWSNLYLACKECALRHKRDRFPLEDESTRVRRPEGDLRRETRLFIDPCDDEPGRHLRFEGPHVVGTTPMGRATVEGLGLNRKALLVQRQVQLEKVMKLVHPLLSPASRGGLAGLRDRLVDLLASDRGYAQATRQVLHHDLCRSLPQRDPDQARDALATWLDVLEAACTPREIAALWGRFDDVLEAEALARRERALDTLRRSERELLAAGEPARIEAAAGVAAPVGPSSLDLATRPVRLRALKIRGFQAVRRLDVKLPEAEARALPRLSFGPDGVGLAEARPSLPWLVLLGENATGKSSVLEAIALALSGAERLAALTRRGELRWERLLTRGKRSGTIRLELERGSDEVELIDLRFTQQGFQYVAGGERIPCLVRGYGGTRLGPEAPAPVQRALFAVENIFRPRAPLVDADVFFASLTGAREAEAAGADIEQASAFDLFTRAVWDVIRGARPTSDDDGGDLAPSATRYLFAEEDGRLRVRLDGHAFGVDELSAGYQSTIALVADILAGAPPDVQLDPRDLAGIVLVDEIDAHLHPRWRRRILRDLRETFPSIQFVVSTHEPLCLQGVRREDRLVLLRATEPRVRVFDRPDDPSPVGMRADQLLTSRYFGLETTLDQDLDDLFREYYRLLGKAEADRSAAEAQLLDGLKRDLSLRARPQLPLGSTRREQLLFEILDAQLAREQLDPAAPVPDEVKRLVWELWTASDTRWRTT